MQRLIQVGGLLLACAVAGTAADQKNVARNPGTPRPEAIRRAPRNVAGPKAGPKAGNPKFPKQPMGPPLSNPASPAARLFRASPEERDRALEKLPEKLQTQLRTALERFDAMPKPQQEIMIRRAERYAALRPEQQAGIRQQMIALRDLPQERRAAVGLALRRLQPMSEEERSKVVSSDEFKGRFSAEELKIISDLSEVMLPPL
jgi:phage-related protein